MPIEELPIFAYYDKQRFTQFGSMDCANWYGISVPEGKKRQAMYPAMGRQHIHFLNENRLIFDNEPRGLFKTVNFSYVVDSTRVFQIDRFYNKKEIGSVNLAGNLNFAWLAVGTLVYALLTDEHNIYVITENGTSVTYGVITDPNAPAKPSFIASFGNRFVVSTKDTPDYSLTRINLFSDSGNLVNCFTINGSPLFNRASSIIYQMAVLHAQLYIMCDFTTDIWANIPTQITVGAVTREFPWKLNTSYNWDYGIADSFSLSVDFGRMVWLAQNRNGLVAFMASNGGQPENISSQAINVLLEGTLDETKSGSPFLNGITRGFLYQFENTIFYRASAGEYINFGELDITENSSSIEYNFETQTWARVIELNGERNRIQNHIYINNKHLVTVQNDPAIYEMAGNIYHNELRNTDALPQADDAFKKYPMRYELITQQLFLPDYSEFIDDWVEIDFVFGNRTFYRSNAPFLNTDFIVDESSTPELPVYIVSEDDEFIVAEGSDTPTFDDNHYNALFKPHIELYYSDDGGVTFTSADNREFSPLGEYRWRMRWYELDVSRNRCYRLICVSSAPIVILGAVRNTRPVSGGAR